MVAADGDDLTLEVARAGGGPRPDWADCDARRRGLLFLPAADLAGTRPGLGLVASDGRTSVPDPLARAVAAPDQDRPPAAFRRRGPGSDMPMQ